MNLSFERQHGALFRPGCKTGPARLLATAALSACIVICPLARAQGNPVPDGNMDADRVAPRARPNAALALPDPMPALKAFDQLVPFQVEHSRGRRYAIDPDSVRFQDATAMMTVSVKAPGGAVNTGYHAIDCDKQQYRMMAYQSGPQWKAVKGAPRWHNILDLKKRRHQYVALYGASCELGGFRVKSSQDLVRRLHETTAEDQ